MSSALLSRLARDKDAAQMFRPDARFCAVTAAPSDGINAPETAVETPAPDLELAAYERGLAAGHEQAAQEYQAAKTEVEARFSALDSAFAQLALDEERKVGIKLRETVIALCEVTLLPLALDADGLAARARKAANMLQRAQDEKRIQVHPDDLELLRGRVSSDLTLEASTSLERGTLRIVTEEGGIEDGPESWRAIIQEALGEC